MAGRREHPALGCGHRFGNRRGWMFHFEHWPSELERKLPRLDGNRQWVWGWASVHFWTVGLVRGRPGSHPHGGPQVLWTAGGASLPVGR
jgi:hypothetical protein